MKIAATTANKTNAAAYTAARKTLSRRRAASTRSIYNFMRSSWRFENCTMFGGSGT